MANKQTTLIAGVLRLKKGEKMFPPKFLKWNSKQMS